MAVGIFLLVASLGAALGEMVGFRLRAFLPLGGLRLADHVGGAVAGALGVLVVLWLLLPVLADVPGEISKQVRNSTVARAIDAAAPRAPGPLQDLRQQVVDANFPEVFSRLRPAPSTGTPPVATALAPEVVDRVIASTVRVSGQACGRILTGSGFAADTETIVTNAHVVAGVDNPSVIRPDGRRLSATVVVFDPNRDLAVLSVPGLDQAPLTGGDGRHRHRRRRLRAPRRAGGGGGLPGAHRGRHQRPRPRPLRGADHPPRHLHPGRPAGAG